MNASSSYPHLTTEDRSVRLGRLVVVLPIILPTICFDEVIFRLWMYKVNLTINTSLFELLQIGLKIGYLFRIKI